MSSTVQKSRLAALHLFVYVSILFLLLLSSNNLTNYLSKNTVLGVSSQNPVEQKGDEDFWNTFLSKNPNYAPGWNEVGRADKVQEIDPNFQAD